MTNTRLDTQEFEGPHGRRTPIDHFFRSLAASGHCDPIAIILSDGGTDGSVWIKDIKEVGGLTMLQYPNDAFFNGKVQSDQAKMAFLETNHEVQIHISDEGREFDPEDIFDESQDSGGLMNIRHRLQLMACDIKVESQLGQGTRVMIHVTAPRVTS